MTACRRSADRALAARSSVFVLFTLAGSHSPGGLADRRCQARTRPERGRTSAPRCSRCRSARSGAFAVHGQTHRALRVAVSGGEHGSGGCRDRGGRDPGVGVDVVHSRGLLMAGLFLAGLGVGSWDVGMNLEGADVERHLGRAIMPHFHAAFSGGTVVSALLGAALSWAGVRILVHMVAIAVLVVVVGSWSLRSLLPAS